jgi:sigma-54 dependent transcriptional regulator, acetoin dehydrogenase operon transcriptional activator AcoR
MVGLKDISVYLQMIADAINAAFDVNITITDINHVRLAGTGYFKDSIGKKIFAGTLSERSMVEKKQFVVTSPKSAEVCMDCTKTDCKDEIVFCSPIINDDGKVLGVINLTSTSKDQKEELLTKRKNIMDFVENMANLILTKIDERTEHFQTIFLNNQLDAIINTVNEGIIATDQRGIVNKANNYMESFLMTENSHLIGKSLASVLPELTEEQGDFENNEIRLVYGNHKLHALVTSKRLYSEQLGMCGRVYFLKNMLQVRKFLYNMTGQSMECSFNDIIGKSSELASTKEIAKKLARSSSTLLIRGETGTGKELFARAIHYASERRNGPIITINCSAIPENLLESEFFGYDEGAFTGALKGGKPGKLELAHGGSLFLDEIGEMSLHLQSKLLRVLEEKRFTRVGSVKEISVDIRIIAATNAELEKLIEQGRFRKDLYYRLNVLPVVIPPLRERIDDIKILLEHFLKKYALALEKEIQGFTDETIKILTTYYWPGNVRELQNVVEMLTNLESGQWISTEHIPLNIRYNEGVEQIELDAADINHVEKILLTKALRKYGSSKNTKGKIAKALGMSQSSVYRKLKKYNLELEWEEGS